MHLLYLDESGNESDPSDRYFVLAGVALFERQTYFLSRAIEDIQHKHFLELQPVVFHASEIRSGRGFWRSVPQAKRRKVLDDLVSALIDSPDRGRILYAAAVEKSNSVWGEDAVAKATEQVCKRFDTFLVRQFKEHQDAQRGLIVFSEGRFDARAKIWVRDFHRLGTTWGAINNLADIPYFASTKESRLLQIADLVAHAVWLLYEKQDASLVRRLVRYFDCHDGTLHGLVHVRASSDFACGCPACASRKCPGDFGTWVEASQQA